MGSDNAIIFTLIIVPAFIGICISALLLIAWKRLNAKGSMSLRGYAIGYAVCVGINVFVLVVTMGFLFLPCFIITSGPLLFFSIMLSKKIIKETRLRNSILNFMYKLIALLLIWFIAFFPFSLWAMGEIVNIPAKIARNQEIAQLQEEISNYETYADLRSFGLGLYKLQEKGAKHLWDITKPEDHVIQYDGAQMVFENHLNRKDDEGWDHTWGNSNQGNDVLYDVYNYEGTYIIVTPLWDQPGVLYYWGYIYLCKEISKDADLFDIGILDPAVVENFRGLPGEILSRKELSERLGKTF